MLNDKTYESEKELRNEVQKRYGRPLTDREWEYHGPDSEPDWHPPYGNDDVNEIVGELPLSFKPQRRISTLKEVGGKDQQILAGRLVARIVQPWVRQQRKQILGDPNPPCISDTLEEWIKRETPKKPLQKSRHFYYASPNGGRSLQVEMGSKLDKIGRVAKKLAMATNWEEDLAVTHLLTGIVPCPPSIKATEHVRGNYRLGYRVWFVFEVQLDVPPQELKEYYSKMRRQFVKRFKPPNKKTVALVNFVLDTPALSWAERFKQWNRNHRSWKYSYSTHLATAFRRAERNILLESIDIERRGS